MQRNQSGAPASSVHSNSTYGFFENARDFIITGGTFTQIRNHYCQEHRDAGLAVLRQYITSGATFDSAERYPPGRCHPGTREAIINIIFSWVNDPAPTYLQNILWLYGPAGSGKSAIAQTIAEILRKLHRERYGGSFFFARGPTDRGQACKLFTSLAHQLAIHFPSIRALINDALVNDPTLPTKSINVQMHSLIIEPLLNCSGWFDAPTPIIIIDGLDECAGSDIQCDILNLISQAVIEHHIPLRFLVASRPEHWIRNSFETGPLSRITKCVSLRDAVNADNDIEKYLVEGFAQIYRTNIRIMASVSTPWPHPRVINRFVEESSGQFIYASTILKFVGKSSSDFCDPRKQLSIITTPESPHRAAAFSDLDKLYATILAAYPRQDTLKRVLGGLLADASPKAIEIFLGVDAAEIRLVLDALSSLINISGPSYSEDIRILEDIFGCPLFEADITFCHLSFREFLEDFDRSGCFSVTATPFYDELFMALFKTIGTSLTTSYEIEPRRLYKISNSAYHCLTRKVAGNSCYTREIPGLEVLFNDINQRLCTFLARHPICDIPHVAYLIQDMDWIEFIFNLYESDHMCRAASLQCCISELRTGVNLAKNKAVEALLTGSELKITPTLVYLQYRQFISMNLRELSCMPGNTLSSTLSDLLQCRDITGFVYDKGISALKISSICTISFPGFIQEGSTGESRLYEWRNLQIWLSQRCFGSLVEDAENFTNNPFDPNLLSKELIYHRSNVVSEFFDRSELSDILSKKYFRNKYQMSMLNLTLDSSSWKRLSIGREGFYYMTSCAALRWINRQLTNPSSLNLMKEYDENLIRQMSISIREIFDLCFLPTYTSPYFSDLWMYNKAGGPSVLLHPLLASARGDIYNFNCVGQSCLLPVIADESRKFLQFNEEVFKDSPEGAAYVSTLDREAWYPHLAAFLLNVLVKYQYGRLHPQFQDHHLLLDQSTLVQCLPYAQPTQRNLAALRALGYLCPKLNPPWRPPVGFCSLTLDLLMKYDRSSISLGELERFKRWLLCLSTHEGNQKKPWHGRAGPKRPERPLRPAVSSLLNQRSTGAPCLVN